MKKVLILGLAFGLLLMSIVGCSKVNSTETTDSDSVDSVVTEGTKETNEQPAEETSGEPVKLTIAAWGNPEYFSEGFDVVAEKVPELAEKFDYEIIIQGTGPTESATALRLAISANSNIPDIQLLGRGELEEFLYNDLVSDLSDIMAPYKDDVLADAMPLIEYNGKTVAVVDVLKPKIFLYRKDLTNAAGIDIEGIKTLDELLAAGDEFKQIYPDKFLWNLGSTIDTYAMYAFLGAYDAKFIDEDGNYIFDTDPGMRKSLELIKALKDSPANANINTWTPDWENAYSSDILCGELGAFWFTIGAFLPTYAGPENAGNWGISAWPEEIAKGSDSGGSVWFVPKGAPNEEAAKEFLKLWRYSQEGVQPLFEKKAYMPFTQSGMDTIKSLDSDPYFGDELISGYEESMKYFTYSPFTPKAAQELEIMKKHVNEMMAGNKTVDEALASIQADCLSQIGNPLK